MTPTDQSSDHGEREPCITQLDCRRSKQQLMELIDRRDRLARVAAERDAHELPDAPEYQYELTVVEDALARRYPDVWEQQFAAWAVRDAQRIHTPDRPSIHCGICQAFEIGIRPTAA